MVCSNASILLTVLTVEHGQGEEQTCLMPFIPLTQTRTLPSTVGERVLHHGRGRTVAEPSTPTHRQGPVSTQPTQPQGGGLPTLHHIHMSYVGMYACMDIQICYICMYYTYIYIYIYTETEKDGWIHTPTHTHTHIHTHTTCVCVCVSWCSRVCMHAYIPAYLPTCSYITYLYIYIYT